MWYVVCTLEVVMLEQFRKFADSLLDSPYYSRFSPEMLRAVGMPRV
jgi:hypothetical protein